MGLREEGPGPRGSEGVKFQREFVGSEGECETQEEFVVSGE